MRPFIFPILLSASLAFVSEIDSFSLRDERLRDATEELNRLMNGYIAQSIEEANTWHMCDEEAFRDDLHRRIGGIFWSQIEYDIAKNIRIDKRSIARADSIYKDVSFFDAPALFIADLGHIMRMGDYFVGGDKLGHFIEEGFNYYSIIHREGGSLNDALAFGENAELGHFGMATTGIYSYADLAANFQGYKEFWKPLIGSGVDSYVSCKAGRYVSLRPFDWAKHANSSWDEGINCNRYRNRAMTESINNQIAILEKNLNTKLSCPILPDRCHAMIEYFGKIAPRVITKLCF